MEQRARLTQFFDSTLNLAVVCSIALVAYMIILHTKKLDFPAPLQSQYPTVTLEQLSAKELPTYSEVTLLPTAKTVSATSVAPASLENPISPQVSDSEQTGATASSSGQKRPLNRVQRILNNLLKTDNLLF